MEHAREILSRLRELDVEWTAKLRADAFETDRTRQQAVGRIKAIDEMIHVVTSLMRKGAKVDELEELPDDESTVAGKDSPQPPVKPRPQPKPRRWR